MDEESKVGVPFDALFHTTVNVQDLPRPRPFRQASSSRATIMQPDPLFHTAMEFHESMPPTLNPIKGMSITSIKSASGGGSPHGEKYGDHIREKVMKRLSSGG